MRIVLRNLSGFKLREISNKLIYPGIKKDNNFQM